MMNSINATNQANRTPKAAIAWLPLGCAIGIMIVLSIYPAFLVRADGSVDRIATYLLFFSMTAGFVRGVGFIPRNGFLAAIFSGLACLIALSVSAVHRYFF